MRAITIITCVALTLSAACWAKEPLNVALQKVQETYIQSRTNADGRVTRPGSVLVVQIDGVMANLMLTGYSQPYFSDFVNGQIAPSNGLLTGVTNSGATDAQPMAVGAKVYLILMSRLSNTSKSIAMEVVTCGNCTPGTAVSQPLLAMVDIKFPKGFLASASFDQIKQVIDQVFRRQEEVAEVAQSGPVAAGLEQGTGPATPAAASPAALKFPCLYINSQTPTDQLRLNADNTFSLQEAGQVYQGTFAANGNTVELNISGGTKTTATIQGNNLTDSSGQAWVLREQSAGTASVGQMLKNEDIVKMAKAGLDDALIIAKIDSSKCQFDTSTDALIQLKQSGVSAAVLKAIMGAGK